MRDKEYKSYSIRLDKRTISKFRELSRDTRMSHNLLLLNLIKQYDPNKQNGYMPYLQKEKPKKG